MNVLGIYGAFDWDSTSPDGWVHDSGATLFVNNRHICSISEERLTKNKYEGNFPYHSIMYCISYSNICNEDIDIVAIPSHCCTKFYQKYKNNYINNKIKEIFPNARVEVISHHISHAAASVFTSDFNEGSFITLDNSGSLIINNFNDILSAEHSSVGYFNKSKNIFRYFPTLNGLNHFGQYYHEWAWYIYCQKMKKDINILDSKYRETFSGKVMGLCAYGKYNDSVKDYSLSFEGIPSLQFKTFPSNRESFICNDAFLLSAEDKSAYLQKNFEMAILDYLKYLKNESYLEDNICLSGGVFLNVLANTKIKQSNIVKNIHIPPFTSDCGLHFGAACYMLFKSKESIELPKNISLLGKRYTNDLIFEEINQSTTLNYKFFKDFNELCKIVSVYLNENKIIAWFQNKSEFGPRSLGSRSILMNPQPKENKDTLNFRIKHREYWRPFAGVMLEEYVEEYFEENFKSPYMLYSQTVKKEKIKEISAISHHDNTCRIQTVNRDLNYEITVLLEEYYKLTGTPILLNTSFNDNGQPIVETPKDALYSFINMDIDYLIIGNYIITKK
jgi:carbamoyltransferase